jgi:hypothetical protein
MGLSIKSFNAQPKAPAVAKSIYDNAGAFGWALNERLAIKFFVR